MRIILLSFFLTLASVLEVSSSDLGGTPPPSVPPYVVFAGDTVRFDREDLYERMDRELISFTYMHTNSTLMLKRADRLFRVVTPILKAQGVPEDFKYLMAIESNLDPKAASAAGAAGLWQFMKSTATEYGLEVNSEVDERYNIKKATVAACAYIKSAYAKYGDYLTVAASYNAGQNSISRRVEAQRQTSALDMWLPEETTRYIFRILAAKMLFSNPESFGFDSNAIESYPDFVPSEVVSVDYPIPSLVDFAEEHGTTYAALKRANLWLRSDRLTNKNGKTYEIVIP